MKTRFAVAAALAVSAAPLLGQGAPPVAEEPGAQTLGYDEDRTARMTVPVSIGGKGPFRFIVDTGAERTVIARDVADRLQLEPGPRTRVHSVTEASRIDTVLIPALEVAGRKVKQIKAPALDGRHIGAEGMLGVDSLKSQRVSFDFGRQLMTIAPSYRREEKWDADTIVVTARSRFGHLVLVDASVDGEKVWVIVDTGSQATVGNEALKRRLERKGKLGALSPVDLLSVTGGRAAVERSTVARIRLGGADIRNMPVAFGDVHIFRKLDLADRPALLLGMDALRLFERVSVDFANKRVRLLPVNRSEGPSDTQMAAARAAANGS